MTRLAATVARCRREGRAAFIPFLMAGDPDLEITGRLILAAQAAGADVIELGVPFSDPIADGPVIQRAASRSLARGTTLAKVLGLVASLRMQVEIPLVLFTYFNPILARGLPRFAEQAASSGVDGVLCVDLPPEEGARELVPLLLGHGLDTIFLLAPTSDAKRVEKVAATSSGFVYYVSTTGVTGERQRLPTALLAEIKALKKQLVQPLAVGFGISTPQQVAAVGQVADGVVVGSALVRLIEEKSGAPDLVLAVAARVAELAAPLALPRKKSWFRRLG